MTQSSIQFTSHDLPNGKVLMQATLSEPKSLNALNLDMIQGLSQKLDEWESDEDVAAIFLDSEGDKAFCAGGDIVRLYDAMKSGGSENHQFLADFFTQEYRLDYRIHTYPKPIICWGHGYVMGGALVLWPVVVTVL